jgi:Transcriptional regulators
MSVTIHDVAKRAGVSVGSVSRYINGYTLKDRNRLSIEQAIKELGFKENIIARGLKNSRTMTIGVVIGSLTDIFSTSIVTSLERVLEKENYSLIICDYEGERLKFKQKIDFLKDRLVDGMVIFPGNGRGDILKEVLESRVPAVIINDDVCEAEVDKVLVDNSNASFRAIEKLIHLGHKHIAVINGPEGNYVSQERYRGYLEAMKLYNLTVEPRYVKCGGFNSNGSYNAVMELFNEPEHPTALYITNYYMTLGALMAINQKGIKVPGQLSVIGFDRFELMDVVKPTLTVIEQPTAEIGEAAAQVLLKRLKGDYSDFPQRLQLNTRMVIGESTGPYKVE